MRNLDVSTGGALGVSCGDDGRLLIWETATGDIRVSHRGPSPLVWTELFYVPSLCQLVQYGRFF